MNEFRSYTALQIPFTIVLFNSCCTGKLQTNIVFSIANNIGLESWTQVNDDTKIIVSMTVRSFQSS